MAGLRRSLKHAIEFTLAGRAAHQLGRYWRRGQRLILAYHNIVPADTPSTGDHSLHLSFDAFRKQLDLLVRSGNVTSLATALDPGYGGPSIALTFDDAYAGAVTLGLPEVSSRGLPATLFVAPGLLGQAAPWWDLLATPYSGLSPALRDMCLGTYQGDYDTIVNWAGGTGRADSAGEWCRIASESELGDAARLPGLTFAAHSWSHPNLAAISPERLREELRKPLAWLREHFPRQVKAWLAYPYGLHNSNVAAEADSAGYEACFAIKGGWHSPGENRNAVPRLNVPAGLSPAGFQAQVNGWTPFS